MELISAINSTDRTLLVSGNGKLSHHNEYSLNFYHTSIFVYVCYSSSQSDISLKVTVLLGFSCFFCLPFLSIHKRACRCENMLDSN